MTYIFIAREPKVTFDGSDEWLEIKRFSSIPIFGTNVATSDLILNRLLNKNVSGENNRTRIGKYKINCREMAASKQLQEIYLIRN